jgi:hypothetical protein
LALSEPELSRLSHQGEALLSKSEQAERHTKREAKKLTRFGPKMSSSSLRKIKEKLEKKNKKPRKARVFNREDGPQCDVSATVQQERCAAQPQSSSSRRQDEQGL